MQLAPCNTKTEPKQHCMVVRANYDNKTPHNRHAEEDCNECATENTGIADWKDQKRKKW